MRGCDDLVVRVRQPLLARCVLPGPSLARTLARAARPRSVVAWPTSPLSRQASVGEAAVHELCFSGLAAPEEGRFSVPDSQKGSLEGPFAGLDGYQARTPSIFFGMLFILRDSNSSGIKPGALQSVRGSDGGCVGAWVGSRVHP